MKRREYVRVSHLRLLFPHMATVLSEFPLTGSYRFLSHESAEGSRVVFFRWSDAERYRDILDGLDVVFRSDEDG